jgi:hypothetical protein
MAAQEVFGRTPLQFGGAFSADAATVTFGAIGDSGDTTLDAGIGLLTQQLGINYQQPVTRIYELGTRFVYYIAGRCQGNANIARILGPRPIMGAFYAQYGNVCNAAENSIIFYAETGCVTQGDLGDFGVGPSMLLQMTGVVLTTIAETVRAEDMVLNEQLQLMFISLLTDVTAGVAES